MPHIRPRRRWILLAALALLLVGGVWACSWLGQDVPNERPDLEATLVAAAEAAGSGNSVDLTDAVTFPWDRGFILGPYTAASDVRKCVGFDWSPVSAASSALGLDAAFMPSEGFSLMVFVAGETQVTGWSVFSPYDGAPYVGFEYVGDWCLEFSRDNATFPVERGAPGYWTFVPATAHQTNR
jgi:hypothetical protein